MKAMIEPATPKQLAYIEAIERTIDETFTGSTKQEASQWIDEHKDFYEEMKWVENGGAFIPRCLSPRR